jgi:hypothetical protein
MRISVLIAALLFLPACEVAREVYYCDRSLETEVYQGPCFGRETFKRSTEGE